MINEYISEYFFKSEKIVDQFNRGNTVVMQFFQKIDDSIFSGIEEVLELLKDKLKDKNIKIKYLPEGTLINRREVVLEIEGRYQDFGIYEGIIDGILSRNTSLATNAYRCIKAAKGKEIICMSDRSDHYSLQKKDGKALYIGGIRSFSSEAQASYRRENCVVYGSIPHAVIQNFEGDLIKVMKSYGSLFPDEDLIALVDFNNDVINDSLMVLSELKDRLKGVRVDTSMDIMDKTFNHMESEYGVTPELIKRLRRSLDDNDGKHVKIYVSSGFDVEKIANFEEQKTPVDGYGVGDYLLKINNTFSGDAVKIGGKCFSKVGRGYKNNPKLIEYRWE